MRAAIILCERVLADMLAEDSHLVGHLHEPALDYWRGALQTYAIRISLAVHSGDADEAYIPNERHEGDITFGDSLAGLAADKWGLEAGQAVASMLNARREEAGMAAGFGVPSL